MTEAKANKFIQYKFGDTVWVNQVIECKVRYVNAGMAWVSPVCEVNMGPGKIPARPHVALARVEVDGKVTLL